ncbi:hypothetical protein HK099_005188 [Clydaea vesicula]|uniref:Uncharacterized protein n=1 Tax=Clydaea vesicula TaxID=447962 RepID=A0AAD5XXR2_9FUNG|nr:hypothetical protein HK099_005188 [Clydaea vesicula]
MLSYFQKEAPLTNENTLQKCLRIAELNETTATLNEETLFLKLELIAQELNLTFDKSVDGDKTTITIFGPILVVDFEFEKDKIKFCKIINSTSQNENNVNNDIDDDTLKNSFTVFFGLEDGSDENFFLNQKINNYFLPTKNVTVPEIDVVSLAGQNNVVYNFLNPKNLTENTFKSHTVLYFEFEPSVVVCSKIGKLILNGIKSFENKDLMDTEIETFDEISKLNSVTELLLMDIKFEGNKRKSLVRLKEGSYLKFYIPANLDDSKGFKLEKISFSSMIQIHEIIKYVRLQIKFNCLIQSCFNEFSFELESKKCLFSVPVVEFVLISNLKLGLKDKTAEELILRIEVGIEILVVLVIVEAVKQLEEAREEEIQENFLKMMTIFEVNESLTESEGFKGKSKIWIYKKIVFEDLAEELGRPISNLVCTSLLALQMN